MLTFKNLLFSKRLLIAIITAIVMGIAGTFYDLILEPSVKDVFDDLTVKYNENPISQNANNRDISAVVQDIKAIQDVVEDLKKEADNPDASNEAITVINKLKNGDTISAENKLNEILNKKIVQGSGNNRDIAKTARHLGSLALLRNPSIALKYYQKAADIEPDNPVNWHLLGNLHYRFHDFAQAIDSFHKALRLNSSKGHDSQVAGIFNNLGHAYFSQGDYLIAEEYFNKSMAIYQDMKSLNGIAKQFANLGKLKFRRGKLSEAERLFTKSLERYQQIEKIDGIAYIYENLGNLYKVMRAYDEAKRYYEESIVNYKKLNKIKQVNLISHEIKQLPAQ